MRYVMTLGLLMLAMGCDSKPKTDPNRLPKDNTGVNARDVEKTTKTPIDQNENQHDLDITANIRKQIVDKKLSIKAQNIKIITQDGKTTLRGPVDTADEKQRVEQIAHSVAGQANVTSEVEVAAP
ncbi:MAG: BON domain-containing protein [Pirellulales bacterium]